MCLMLKYSFIELEEKRIPIFLRLLLNTLKVGGYDSYETEEQKNT